MSKRTDYWRDAIVSAMEECKATLTEAQIDCLAKGAEDAHDCYSEYFYSPTASEHIRNEAREKQRQHEVEIAAKDKEIEQQTKLNKELRMESWFAIERLRKEFEEERRRTQ